MFDLRLMKEVPKTKKYIFQQILLQWLALLANIIVMFKLSFILVNQNVSYIDLLIIGGCILLRFVTSIQIEKMGNQSARVVKKHFREKIIYKLYTFGPCYKELMQTSGVVQIMTEGIEQLEIYFAKYVPQFFYSLLAPFTLFLFCVQLDRMTAIVLFLCVPLIPMTIICIQKIAKRFLSSYWEQYTSLGDTFLENIQGLTTTKIYQSDAFMHQKMNDESESFRKITMRVLSMQLNSIIVMDVIAYGGAALGMFLSILAYHEGSISYQGCLFIILVSADFFLPMRLLGSYFHIAMNGMAASEQIFKLFDMETSESKKQSVDSFQISIQDVSFAYDKNEVLKNLTMQLPMHRFISIVGESGSGKSTIAALLLNKHVHYSGNIYMNNVNIKDVDVSRYITYVGSKDYIFSGTVQDHLLMANPNASDQDCWRVLKTVNLDSFMRSQDGLQTKLYEQGSNLSGGQKQRLNMARALLHDTPIYIFDEATSNIDVESEDILLKQIELLSKKKTILFISHRLENVRNSDWIYVLKNGMIQEQGTFDILLANQKEFTSMWNVQNAYMHFMEEDK